jgi:predicted component of type VI protein secretion system
MPSVTVTFGGEVVGEFPVEKNVCVVGREATCEIHIDNLGVSRTHCQFIKRGQAYVLQDMNSANGTYVNGKRVGEHYLNDGDEILIGKHTMKYKAQGVAQPPASATAAPEADMGDALHTYVMDGAKIRERLAGMHATGEEEAPAPAGQIPGTARLSAVPGASGGGAGSGAPMKAADHALEFDPLKPRSRPTAQVQRPYHSAGGGGTGGDGVKFLLYFSLVTNLVLIGLIVLLIMYLMKLTPTGPVGSYSSRPPSVSAPDHPEDDPADESKETSTDDADDSSP